MPKKRVYKTISESLETWLKENLKVVGEDNGRATLSPVEITKRSFSFSGVYKRETPVPLAPIDFVYLVDRRTLESKVKLQKITTGDYYYYGAKGLNIASAIQRCLDAIVLVKIKEEHHDNLNEGIEADN
jgi:hypothetical protein